MKSIRRNLNAKPTGTIQPKMLDVAGAAAFLGTSDRWIRRRISRGLLPYRKFAGRYVFLRIELEAFITTLPGVSLDEAKANLRIRTGGQR